MKLTLLKMRLFNGKTDSKLAIYAENGATSS